MYEIVRVKDGLPPLREPVLIAAFAVRRRAGRLASTALGHMVEAWSGELVAKIESEDFLDFTVRRPNVRRVDDTPVIDWPETTLHLASPAGSKRDFLLLEGFEPNFQWRTYVEALTQYADGLGVKMLVSLRSFPGNVPHTRPAPILINSSDVDLEVQFGVQSRGNRYEGPTDIAGVLAAAVQSQRWQTVDLTVLQPYYFPRMPNAAGMIALIKVLDHAFGTETPVGQLAEAAEAQIKAIESGISGDSDTRTVISQLERQYDDGAARMDFLADEPESDQPSTLPSGDEVIKEIERLLREGPSPGA